MSHEQHRRVMLLTVVARNAVRRDHDVEVAEHGIARSRLDTPLRRTATDHHCFDAVAAQEHVEVGAEECARTVLWNDELFREWGKPGNEIMAGRTRCGVAQR